MIDNAYNFDFDYTLDPTNTFVSASLIHDINGVSTEVTKSLTGNTGTTFYIDTNNSNIDSLHSGSKSFTVGVHVQLEDGSKTSVETSTLTNGSTTLNKLNPNQPSYTFDWTGLSNDSYITNKTNTSTSAIERGVTGDATYTSASSATLRGWTETNVTNNKSGNTITFTATGDPANLTVTGNYNSNGLGTPTTTAVSDDKAFSRIISLRYAAFPSGHFTSNLAPTEAELLDLADWTDNGGTLDFNTINPNNENFTVSWTGDKYIYIVMDDAYTLTEINIGILNQIGSFTTNTVGGYRFYVTTDIQSDSASPLDITLVT